MCVDSMLQEIIHTGRSLVTKLAAELAAMTPITLLTAAEDVGCEKDMVDIC